MLLNAKRKRPIVYAVRSGRRRGIFYSWEECKEQIDGLPHADYQGFQTVLEAKHYLQKSTAPKISKYFANTIIVPLHLQKKRKSNSSKATNAPKTTKRAPPKEIIDLTLDSGQENEDDDVTVIEVPSSPPPSPPKPSSPPVQSSPTIPIDFEEEEDVELLKERTPSKPTLSSLRAKSPSLTQSIEWDSQPKDETCKDTNITPNSMKDSQSPSTVLTKDNECSMNPLLNDNSEDDIVEIPADELKLKIAEQIVVENEEHLDADDELESHKEDDDESEEPPKLTQITFTCKVVGIRHYDGVAKAGDEVSIQRQPKNPHDRLALKVLNSKGEQIGHIESSVAKLVSPLIDTNGAQIHDAVLRDGDEWFMWCEVTCTGTAEVLEFIQSNIQSVAPQNGSEAVMDNGTGSDNNVSNEDEVDVLNDFYNTPSYYDHSQQKKRKRKFLT